MADLQPLTNVVVYAGTLNMSPIDEDDPFTGLPRCAKRMRSEARTAESAMNVCARYVQHGQARRAIGCTKVVVTMELAHTGMTHRPRYDAIT